MLCNPLLSPTFWRSSLGFSTCMHMRIRYLEYGGSQRGVACSVLIVTFPRMQYLLAMSDAVFVVCFSMMTETIATRSNKMNTTMDVSKKKKSAAFATPDRDIPEPTSKKEPTPAASEDIKTVTPPEFTPNGKQVRFDKDESPGSTKRGLVSRRGGRYGSPARKDTTTGVVEYKTYRSPKRETESSDGVPSLCSTASGTIKEEIKPASSISLDKAETTSPLQEDGSPSKKAIAPKATESRNVTFSPRPTVSDCVATDRVSVLVTLLI